MSEMNALFSLLVSQVQIALKKFKGVAIQEALLRLDESVLKLEDLPRLRECAPSAEELELLAPYLEAAEGSELDKVF